MPFRFFFNDVLLVFDFYRYFMGGFWLYGFFKSLLDFFTDVFLVFYFYRYFMGRFSLLFIYILIFRCV